MLLALETLTLFAQRRPDAGAEVAAAGALGVFLVLYLALIAASIAFTIWYLVTMYTALDRLPAECREYEPWQVLLMLIPCFNIIWQFFLLPGVARSYERYFTAQGRTDQGDCGAALGLWACILSFIPCLNIVAVVMIIMYILKISGLKKMVR